MIKNIQISQKISLILCFAALLVLAGCSFFREENNINNTDKFSYQDLNVNLSEDGKSFFCEVKDLLGYFEIAETNVQNNCNLEIQFSSEVNSGKAKLILTKPDNSTETLKEIDSNKNGSCSENLYINCVSGVNKIKLVGENCTGNFEISQNNEKVFNYTQYNMFNKPPMDLVLNSKNNI